MRNHRLRGAGHWSVIGHCSQTADLRTLCFQGCRDRASTWRPSGGLGPSDDLRPTSRPLKHSHLKKHTSRPSLEQRPESNRKGAGQPVRQAGTEHPPRAILAAHEVKHLDHLVSRSRYRIKLLLRLPKRVPAPSFSTGLALSSVDSQRLASADKAHIKVYTVTEGLS